MMIRLPSLALAAASTFLALPATAQFAKAEDAVKYRQSVMFLQNHHFGRIAAMANGRIPYDPAAAVAGAEVVAMVSQLPWSGAYGPGTQGGNAKPEIWKETDKFKGLSDKLVAETGKLLATAKGGNLDALKAAVGSVNDTCKACHDAFRKEQ